MGEIEGFYTLPKMPEELQQLLDKLFSARRSASLYQPDHPIAAQAREMAFAVLTVLLRRQSKLTLAAVDEGLLLDRKLYRQTADSHAFSKRFRQRGIARVLLKVGTDISELTALLALLDTDPVRIRAKGGPASALREAGVTNITLVEEHMLGEEEQEQQAPIGAPPVHELPLDRQEAILSLLADYLVGKAEDLEDEQYPSLMAVLRDPPLTAKLVGVAVSRADRSQLDRGKTSFAGHVIQRIESTVLARSAGDWEEVKHKVREAVAQLPPAIRPKIFALQAPSWREEGTRATAPSKEAVSPQRISAMLGELAKLLADLRGVPAGIAVAAGEGIDYAPAISPAEAAGKKSRLATLLEGMAAMRIPPTPAREELADLMQSVDPRSQLVNLSWVLLDILEREQKLDTYSKVATELEQLGRQLIEQGHTTPALHLLSVLTAHSEERLGCPAWQRLRSAGALQAIGSANVLEFICRVFREGHPEQVKVAAEIVASMGKSALPPLIDLLAEPLSAAAENSLMEVLVRAGNDAVPELANSLQSGYSQAGVCLVKVLSEIGTDDALKALAKGLASRDVLVRLAVIQALGKKSSDFSAVLLMPALQDANPSVARAAASALGELRNPVAVTALAKAVTAFSWTYSDVHERMEMVSALGKIGDEAAITVLARILHTRRLFGRGHYEQLRQASARALGRIATPAALQALSGKNGSKETSAAEVQAETKA